MAAQRAVLQVRTLRGDVAIAFRAHDGELVLGFVLEGSAKLDFGGTHRAGARTTRSSFRRRGWPSEFRADFRLLHVTTRGWTADCRHCFSLQPGANV